MPKRFHIALAVVLVVLAGVIAWQVFQATREREPVYEGKRLSFWLEAYYQGMIRSQRYVGSEEQANWNRQVGRAEQAIQHIGTDALPLLIARLHAQDSRLKQLMMTWAGKQKFIHFHFKSANERRGEAIFGYRALGPLASTQVPSLMGALTNDPSPHIRQAAARVLGFIGPEAKLAAPALFHAAKDTDKSVRTWAFWALGRILPDPHLTIPVLVAGLDDPYPGARTGAALALGSYGPAARAAVPALLRSLATNISAGYALRQIDPEAAAKAGLPQTATSQGVNRTKEVIPLVRMDNVPLTDAIRNLAEQANISYIFDPWLSRSSVGPDGKPILQPSISVLWTNVTAEGAFSMLLKAHQLTMVSNPATSVMLITFTNRAAKPISAFQVGGDTSPVIPLIEMDSVPFPIAISHLAREARLTVSLDPRLSASSSAPSGGAISECAVSLLFKKLTARQALAALLDNYDLVMIQDAGGSSATITTKEQAGAGAVQKPSQEGR